MSNRFIAIKLLFDIISIRFENKFPLHWITNHVTITCFIDAHLVESSIKKKKDWFVPMHNHAYPIVHFISLW